MENVQPLSFIKSDRKATMKLYRYFSNIEYAIEEIENGEIYCPLSDSFNDIFDCKIVNTGSVLDSNLSGELSVVSSLINKILLECEDFFIDFFDKEKDFGSMEKEFAQKEHPNHKTTPHDYLRFVHSYSNRNDSFEKFYDVIKQSYIKKQPIISLCKRGAFFSEVNDSILMWSYYGDKHQGLCLEYDPTLLIDGSVEKQKIFDSIQKVHYSNNQYNNPNYIRSIDDLNAVFFTKALCWSHEQEWRIVLSDNIERLKFPCLTGIYLGA